MTRGIATIPSIGLALATALLATLPGFAEPRLPSPTTVAECTSVSGVVVDNPVSCSAGGGVAQVTLAPFAECRRRLPPALLCPPADLPTWSTISKSWAPASGMLCPCFSQPIW
jgi:hypothetical protein